MYIAQDLKHLTKFLQEQPRIPSNIGAKDIQHVFGHDMWLIFLLQPSRRKRAALVTILKDLPIRLDSCIFAFYKQDDGKICIALKNILLQYY